MGNFSLGDSVYFGSVHWVSYIVVDKNDQQTLNVKISKTGSDVDAFWVMSKHLLHIY